MAEKKKKNTLKKAENTKVSPKNNIKGAKSPVNKKPSKSNIRKKKDAKKNQKLSNKNYWLRLLIYCSVAIFGLVVIYVAYCWLTLPDISHAVSQTRQPSTTIIAENGEEIKSFGSVYSEVIYPEELPFYVKSAIISTEDRRFYSHHGFDPVAFVRAMLTNLRQMRYAQGGSTITQQVAKNLFLTPQKNIKRKVQELLMAFWLEKNFNKNQILTLYLNRVYMGAGTYGIEAASRKYFQKSARDVNLLEASILAGLLKAPTRYNPIANKDRSIERAKVVLQNMVENNIIDTEQKERAQALPIGPEKSSKVEGGKYFADWVYAEVNSRIGERDKDINVYTTLDKRIQLAAEKILTEAIKANAAKNVTNGAIVVLDKDGAVKAMVGGVNYEASQFNRAVQALRQPGSVFKTFVYLAALKKGFSPKSRLQDEPIIINGWKPENADKKYHSEVTLTQAFTKSYNLATVNLSQNLSLRGIINLAHKMGISSPIENTPSMVLGTSDVKVLDIAIAYSTIANGGFANWPYTVTDIYSNDGYQMFVRIPSQKERILDQKDVKNITKMLEEVIESGTGKRAKLPFFAAGKTGTSQDYRNAWFAGFTENYVTVVWLGNDDNSPMKNVGGSGLPAEIWKKVMLEAEGGK